MLEKGGGERRRVSKILRNIAWGGGKKVGVTFFYSHHLVKKFLPCCRREIFEQNHEIPVPMETLEIHPQRFIIDTLDF